MLYVHILPGGPWVDDETFAAVEQVASEAIAEVRSHLPALASELYLLVHQTTDVVPETGDGGFTVGPHCIRWDVDPARGVTDVARGSLRATLFHECHHAVRLQRRPEDAGLLDWLQVAVFEGLATVFAHSAGGFEAPWRTYDPDVVADWAQELFAQPIGPDAGDWRFHHPDGRRFITYRVGCWIVDAAVAASGRSAADLVWASPEEVRALAALDL